MAVGGIRQTDQKDIPGLEKPYAGEALLDQIALAGRGGIEMRVEPGRGTAIEPAHGRDVGDGGDGIENLETEARALPARKHARVEGAYFVRVGGDEIMIELLIVILDRVEQIAARRHRVAPHDHRYDHARDRERSAQGSHQSEASQPMPVETGGTQLRSTRAGEGR